MHRLRANVVPSLLLAVILVAPAASGQSTSSAAPANAAGSTWSVTVGAGAGTSLWSGPGVSGTGSGGSFAVGLVWRRDEHWGLVIEGRVDGRTAEIDVGSDFPNTELSSTGGRVALLARRWFTPRAKATQAWVDAGVTLIDATCDVTYSDPLGIFGDNLVENCATWRPSGDAAPVFERAHSPFGARVAAGVDGRRFGMWISAEPLAQKIAKRTEGDISARLVSVGVQYHLFRR